MWHGATRKTRRDSRSEAVRQGDRYCATIRPERSLYSIRSDARSLSDPHDSSKNLVADLRASKSCLARYTGDYAGIKRSEK